MRSSSPGISSATNPALAFLDLRKAQMSLWSGQAAAPFGHFQIPIPPSATIWFNKPEISRVASARRLPVASGANVTVT